MSGAPAASLRLGGLSVARGDRLIIADFGIEVFPGEVLHLQGRNGAGKTSLLEVMAGLRQPERCAVDQRPEPSELHWIGHKNALNALLSPLENLRFWAQLNGVDPAGCESALREVGLKSAQWLRPCAGLSTGQRRRAALARLRLVHRPCWLLDEPLAGLDAAGIDLLASLLSAHAGAGGAAVVSSHQPLPVVSAALRVIRLGAPISAAPAEAQAQC